MKRYNENQKIKKQGEEKQKTSDLKRFNPTGTAIIIIQPAQNEKIRARTSS